MRVVVAEMIQELVELVAVALEELLQQ